MAIRSFRSKSANTSSASVEKPRSPESRTSSPLFAVARRVADVLAPVRCLLEVGRDDEDGVRKVALGRNELLAVALGPRERNGANRSAAALLSPRLQAPGARPRPRRSSPRRSGSGRPRGNRSERPWVVSPASNDSSRISTTSVDSADSGRNDAVSSWVSSTSCAPSGVKAAIATIQSAITTHWCGGL